MKPYRRQITRKTYLISPINHIYWVIEVVLRSMVLHLTIIW